MQRTYLDQACRVPPNLHFEIDDMEEEWVYESKFDLIHMRMLGGAIRDWPRLMRQIFKSVDHHQAITGSRALPD